MRGEGGGVESCPPSGSRSAGNNGHGLRGDNARRSRAAWVAGHVHHRLGHPGPRPVPPQPGGPRTPRSTRCVCGGVTRTPRSVGKRAGVTPNLEKSVPPLLSGGSALSPRIFGVPPHPVLVLAAALAPTPALNRSRYRAAPRCARAALPPFPHRRRPFPPSQPSRSPPPLIIPVIPRQPPCPNAGMCEANRARLFRAWERAEGARGPPPAAPRPAPAQTRL